MLSIILMNVWKYKLSTLLVDILRTIRVVYIMNFLLNVRQSMPLTVTLYFMFGHDKESVLVGFSCYCLGIELWMIRKRKPLKHLGWIISQKLWWAHERRKGNDRGRKWEREKGEIISPSTRQRESTRSCHWLSGSTLLILITAWKWSKVDGPIGNPKAMWPKQTFTGPTLAVTLAHSRKGPIFLRP